jgi:hypothetical protein
MRRAWLSILRLVGAYSRIVTVRGGPIDAFVTDTRVPVKTAAPPITSSCLDTTDMDIGIA